MIIINLSSPVFMLYPGLSYLIYTSTTIKIKPKQNTNPNTLDIFSWLGIFVLVCFFKILTPVD